MSIILFTKTVISVIFIILIASCDKKITKEDAQLKVFIKKANPENFKAYFTFRNSLSLKDSIEKWETNDAPVKLRLIGAYSQYILNYEYVVFELKNFSEKDYCIAVSNSLRINSLFIQKGSLNNWDIANSKGLKRSNGDIKIVPLLKGESLFLLCDFHIIDGIYSKFRYYVEPKRINEVAFFQRAKKKYGEKLLLGPIETSGIDNLKGKFKGINWAGPKAFSFENIEKFDENH
jgi:hypothetical protein